MLKVYQDLLLFLKTMRVCIAEKPSVAREIAQILGANTRMDGYMEGNGFQVTWTFGHLCTLKEPHEYNPAWKRWSLFSLPLIPDRFAIQVINDEGIQKQFNIVEKLFQNASEIINCGDAGQEGELIQRWVMQKSKCTCPIKRLWISSLTEDAIKDGFRNLKDSAEFDSLYKAGLARAAGDWLLGINATRLYTLKYGQNKQVLSLGRVQTPTLALIVNRQNEIENFNSKPFWELKTKYRNVVFNADKGRFEDKGKGEEVLNKVAGKPFEIKSVLGKEGRELSPRLFDLTSLQVECNKRFGFSADHTLKTIQSLYEKKLTSYPRVDTTYLPNDMYAKVPSILKGMQSYSELTKPLLQAPLKKTKQVFDDKKVTDHHAIIPTGLHANNIYGDETSVYDLIARRFIAVFYPDCKIFTTSVVGAVDEISFKTSGKQILDPGWKVVIPGKNSDADDQILPAFKVGETGEHTPELMEKKTQPPKYFTEASLLRAMETAGKQVDDEDLRDALKGNGIGRPSTRAGIIETLVRRKYIQKQKKRLLATLTGKELINTIQSDLLKSVELTGEWEKKLRMIEEKEYDPNVFMAELKTMVWQLVNDVKQDTASKQITLIEDAKSKEKKPAPPEKLMCPVCEKGVMMKGKSAWGCNRFNAGCSFVVAFDQFGKKISQNQFEKLISKKKTSIIKGFSQNQVKINGYLHIDGNNVVLKPEEKKELVCPICQKGNIVKGHKAFGCTNFKSGCAFRVPFEVYGKKIIQSYLQQLSTSSKTRTIKGFKIEGQKVNGIIYIVDGKMKFKRQEAK